MTHIICRAMTCLYWDEGTCSAEEMEYEPDLGCLTFQDLADLELAEEDDDEIGWEEEEEEDPLDDDDDDWVDDEWDEDPDL